MQTEHRVKEEDAVNTVYGKLILSKSNPVLINAFSRGDYYNEYVILKLQKLINPTRNILEIGGYCGTSSIVYSHFLHNRSNIYVYEPRKELFKLLKNNITQNDLSFKIVPIQKGLSYHEGEGYIKNNPKKPIVETILYNNFEGVPIKYNDEKINTLTLDSLNHENIGFIHCLIPYADYFIFAFGKNFIKKHRPVIFFRDSRFESPELNTVVYKKYKKYSAFNIIKYCMEELKYSMCFEGFSKQHLIVLVP